MKPESKPSATGSRSFPPAWLRVVLVCLALGLVAEPILARVMEASPFGRRTIPASLGAEGLHGRAPEVALVDLDGERVELSDFRGRLVLLHFWATWCPSCLDELPELDALASVLDEERFVVLAASVDEDAGAVRDLLEQTSQHSLVAVMDRGGVAAALYGSFKYPETYFIGRDGELLARFAGPRPWSSSTFRAYFEGQLER